MSGLKYLPIRVLPNDVRSSINVEPNHFKIGYVDYVIDGDSVWFWIDLDFDEIYAHRNCRLLGIDAPDKAPGKATSKQWLIDRLPTRTKAYLYTPGRDKYGRLLTGIYLSAEEPSLNVQSFEAGMSVPYEGGPR